MPPTLISIHNPSIAEIAQRQGIPGILQVNLQVNQLVNLQVNLVDLAVYQSLPRSTLGKCQMLVHVYFKGLC